MMSVGVAENNLTDVSKVMNVVFKAEGDLVARKIRLPVEEKSMKESDEESDDGVCGEVVELE